jgi:hypothetical protein
MEHRINCQWIQKHVHVILDGDLPPDQRVPAEIHINCCEDCKRLLVQTEAEEDTLRSALRLPRAPDGFAEEVLATLRGTTVRGAPAPPAIPFAHRWWQAVASVAAILVLGVGAGLWFAGHTEPGTPAVADGTPRPPRDTDPGAVTTGLPPVAASAAAVRGGVQVRLAQDAPWKDVVEGQKLRIGSQLRTRKGAFLEVRIGESVTSRIDENGLVRLAAGGLFMNSGRVFCDVAPGGQGFAVETPDAVAAVTGTRFQVDRRTENATQLRVVEGTVEFRNPERQVPVKANMQAVATAAKAPGPVLYADHFPAVSWAAVSEAELDFPVDVALTVNLDASGSEISGTRAPFVARIDYGEVRFGELWLYCEILDTSGESVARKRVPISSSEHRYRIRKVAFRELPPGTYTARFRIGHGPHATVAERGFTVR